MKGDKEFSGTLLGFDDYVSTYSAVAALVWLDEADLTLSRHGA